MIESIALNKILPDVFNNDEKENRVFKSQIWLKDIIFEKGKKYIIEAESGNGKTSLFSFILGLRNDYSGIIYLDNKNIREFSKKDICRLRRESIACVPQEMGLFPSLTIWENIHIKNNLTHFCKDSHISALIEHLGLKDKNNVTVNRLSIGQQQRVAFIRSLCQPTDFMLLDEPVSHLDKKNNKIVSEILEEHYRNTGAGIIVTSVGNRIQLTDMKELSL